jgi:PHD/YefM family antitoxin component YafN of YafNO toxin-antitoxin module
MAQHHTYSISAIREEITRLPEHFDREPDAVTVTRHGKPVMAILPWELYEALIETLEVMSDAELMAAFRQGAQELAEGKGQSRDNVKRDLGLCRSLIPGP